MLGKQLHIVYIMFSNFFIDTHTHSWKHLRLYLQPHSSTRSACSQKICRFSACCGAGGAAHTARHEILKRVQKSRTPGGEGGEEAERYTSTRCSLHITRRWRSSSLWSASSGGEQTDYKAQHPSEHGLTQIGGRVGLFSTESLLGEKNLSFHAINTSTWSTGKVWNRSQK